MFQLDNENHYELTDKELRSIIYHHNSAITRIKAIGNIKSRDVLYHIFHSLNDFKEEFIERYYELGGHSLDIMIFLLPPYLKSGDLRYDVGYRELVKQFRSDLQGQEYKKYVDRIKEKAIKEMGIKITRLEYEVLKK